MILCIIGAQIFTREIFVRVKLIGSVHAFSSQENAAQGTVLRADSSELPSQCRK